MGDVNSMGILVGSSACNAKCQLCAGIPHRKDAPRKDWVVEEPRVEEAIRECCERGARYISLSGSGEPTMSPGAVTKVLGIIKRVAPPLEKVCLYTNGIRFGADKGFEALWLPAWKGMGLTDIQLSVHDFDLAKNAKGFGISYYPDFDAIFGPLRKYGYRIRANIMLQKGYIDSAERFRTALRHFRGRVDKIVAWPVRRVGREGISPKAPSAQMMGEIKEVASGFEDVDVYWPEERSAGKLTLFPDGSLRDTWC